ncbi:MAG: TfoX/Sxy family protein [Bacteroidota bacterium]
MTNIANLPNIGKNLASKLKNVEINTSDDLINLGSEKAFLKLIENDRNCCVNMLYAIEGAIQNIRWHNISNDRKKQLNDFYKCISGKSGCSK